MSLFAISIFNKYVRLSEKGSVVILANTHLCNITFLVQRSLSIVSKKVYISTRVLKHVYDKRPASEFDLILNNLSKIIKYPDFVYENKSGKRGSFCFVKQINNRQYLCSVEISTMVNEDTKESDEKLDVVTFFSTDEKYLKNYKLLWEWKGGNPSS